MKFGKYLSRDRFSLRQVVGMLTLVILGGAILAYATTVTIPYSFTSGTPAKASEVNANFTALANAINNRTPATLANMAGTWSYTEFVSFVNGNMTNGNPTLGQANSAQLCTVALSGTITLNSDGSYQDVKPAVSSSCVDAHNGTTINFFLSPIASGTWNVSATGSGTIFYSGVPLYFQASRDLNTVVASQNILGSSTFTVSVTAVRQ